MNYTLLTLDNGLRVAHHEDSSTAMVAVNLLYDVGARDDPDSHTGLAHLMEHLMFGGSINVPDFDSALEAAGGTNNAWTSDDFTCFWDLIPAQNVETAFRLESDRMLSLAFSPTSLEVQRKVVIEEFKQVCLNRPYGDIGHLVRQMLYSSHPYRYPAIGREVAHIEGVTMDLVRQFFFSHYAPNNAVLSVAGNISLNHVIELSKKWFGDIPRRTIPPRTWKPEPLPNQPVRLVVPRDVPQRTIAIAFPMCGYNGPHFIGADLLTDILSSGQSSRFYRRLLTATDFFTSIDASISGLDEEGYLIVTAALRDPEDLPRAEEAIWNELQKALDTDPSELEIQRALNRYESNYTFNQIHCMAKAQDLALAIIHADDPSARLRDYLASTPARITDAARAIILPSRAHTLIYG